MESRHISFPINVMISNFISLHEPSKKPSKTMFLYDIFYYIYFLSGPIKTTFKKRYIL